MSERRAHDPTSVSWDEAREILVVVLVVAAAMHVLGPVVRYLSSDRAFPLWDDLFTVLNNVNALTGILLLAAAVAICTTPASDVVPRLRQTVYVVSAIVALLGVIYIVNVLTVTTAGDRFWLRLGIVFWRPGPAVLLCGTAAWMARRVVAFPSSR